MQAKTNMGLLPLRSSGENQKRSKIQTWKQMQVVKSSWQGRLWKWDSILPVWGCRAPAGHCGILSYSSLPPWRGSSAWLENRWCSSKNGGHSDLLQLESSDTAIMLTACTAEQTPSYTTHIVWVGLLFVQISVWERQPLFLTLEAGCKRELIPVNIHPFYTVYDQPHSCSAAVTVATCGNYTIVMPFIPHTEYESLYIQGGSYPFTDERLNSSFPLFFTPFLEYTTFGSIALNNQLLQVASRKLQG